MVRQRFGKQFSSSRAQSVERTLQRGVERIWALGFHLDDVKAIEAEHVQALVDSLAEMGYAATTVQSYVGVFRQLGRWLSKPALRDFSVK
jgi:site-specific recombinase XerD